MLKPPAARRVSQVSAIASSARPVRLRAAWAAAARAVAVLFGQDGAGLEHQGVPDEEEGLLQEGGERLPVPLLQTHAELGQGQLAALLQAAQQLHRPLPGLAFLPPDSSSSATARPSRPSQRPAAWRSRSMGLSG